MEIFIVKTINPEEGIGAWDNHKAFTTYKAAETYIDEAGFDDPEEDVDIECMEVEEE